MPLSSFHDERPGKSGQCVVISAKYVLLASLYLDCVFAENRGAKTEPSNHFLSLAHPLRMKSLPKVKAARTLGKGNGKGSFRFRR